MKHGTRNLVVHPGLSGTATTTLQKHFFAKHPQLHAIGNPVSTDFGTELKKADGFYNAERLVNIVKTLCGENISKPIIASDESLTHNYYLRPVIPQRLVQTFPDVKSIITIRKQNDIILSWYMRGGHLSRGPKPFYGRHVEIENFLEYEYENWDFSFLSAIDFNRTISYWEAALGAHNVKVFLFDDFIMRKEQFISEMCDFIGIDPNYAINTIAGKHSNPRHSYKSYLYVKLREYFFPGIPLRKFLPDGDKLRALFEGVLRGGKHFESDLPQKWREILDDRYREGNSKLAKRLNLPLEKYGYSV